MGPMISSSLKPAVTRLINPVARLAIRSGVTPNGVTVVGALGVVASSAYLFNSERYFVGSLVVAFFALSDLFDGAIARISERGPSAWGGFLDSTVDRITDFSIMISILIPLIRHNDKLAYLGLITLVSGLLIPYIRAKAESFSILMFHRNRRAHGTFDSYSCSRWTSRIARSLRLSYRILDIGNPWCHHCFPEDVGRLPRIN
jgi:CDP-diacylglycerol--glycerol-3-phosphate 3-phosphatidyltransferase